MLQSSKEGPAFIEVLLHFSPLFVVIPYISWYDYIL